MRTGRLSPHCRYGREGAESPGRGRRDEADAPPPMGRVPDSPLAIATMARGEPGGEAAPIAASRNALSWGGSAGRSCQVNDPFRFGGAVDRIKDFQGPQRLDGRGRAGAITG